MEGVTEADLPKIKDLLINKVESREKDLSKLEIPAQAEPKAVPVYNGFISFDAEQLAIFYKEHGFAFGLDDLEFIQNYFKTEQRDPTETELKVLDTYWSDHCRHTTFETALTDIKFEDEFKETLENIFNDYLAKRRN